MLRGQPNEVRSTAESNRFAVITRIEAPALLFFLPSSLRIFLRQKQYYNGLAVAFSAVKALRYPVAGDTNVSCGREQIPREPHDRL